MDKPINDLNLLKIIKQACYMDNDIRATWIGPAYPSTNIKEFKPFAEWSLIHLKIYEGFWQEIDINKNYRILDIACGTGYNTNIISNTFTQSEVIGVDLNPTSIEFAKQYNSNSNIIFLVDDILKYKADKKFDFIFCIDTLEHLLSQDHKTAIINLLDNLTLEGKLFLSTPVENQADSKKGHIGRLNNKRKDEFVKTFKNNIILMNYFNNKNLKDPITNNSSSHYRIILKNNG